MQKRRLDIALLLRDRSTFIDTTIAATVSKIIVVGGVDRGAGRHIIEEMEAFAAASITLCGLSGEGDGAALG